MKKLIFVFLLAFIIIMPLISCKKDAGSGKVVLVMGSWRTDDVTQIQAILDEYSKLKDGKVEIQFKPTNPPDYNATLRLQLESGTGPDLMYARSYATGNELFQNGYFEDLTFLPGLQENFSQGAKAPWQTPDGKSFGIPFIAVSHGIYYNKDIFNKLGIKEFPKTWEDFLAMCKKIKAAGITPIANSLGDEWDINEVVFMNLLPNFIGGMDGRLAYEDGKRPFNDADMIAAFQAMKDIAPFFPKGYESLTYNDAIAIFATGQAAMRFDGSWSINAFTEAPFKWSVEAVPPPKGKSPEVCFHGDTGIGMNPKTKYPNEVKEFLAWLCTKEGVEIAWKNIPTGMFPIINNPPAISEEHANAFLSLNNGRATDVRFTWPKLMNGEPSAYNLTMDGCIKIMTGKITPKQAADELAAGLAKWYKPN